MAPQAFSHIEPESPPRPLPHLSTPLRSPLFTTTHSLSDYGLSLGTPVKESRLEQFEFLLFFNALLHLSLSNTAIYARAWETFNVESALLSLAVLSWNSVLLLTMGTTDRLGFKHPGHFPGITVALMMSVCLYCASQSFR
jgi:hypothetical protein